MKRSATILISAASGLVLLAAGTTAAAAIAGGPVDGSGVVHGCWTNAAVNGSHVFVLQDAGTNCPKGTTAIWWNQQGPAGPAGATGPQGPKGDTGPVGAPGAPGTGATVASLASGDPNCANGGASVTDGSGNTAYACNGAAGPAGAGTAGTAGLDVIIVRAQAFNSGSTIAFCPADHPYLLGGGADSGEAGVIVTSRPQQGPYSGGWPDTGPESGQLGWYGQSSTTQSSTGINVWAICAK